MQKFTWQYGTIEQRHRDFERSLDDVIVRHDQSGGVDDEAGSDKRLHIIGLIAGRRPDISGIGLGRHVLAHGDVDHGRQQAPDQVGAARAGNLRHRVWRHAGQRDRQYSDPSAYEGQGTTPDTMPTWSALHWCHSTPASIGRLCQAAT